MQKKYQWKLVLVGVVFVCLSALAINPLRWPDSCLHSWLLKKVPVGSTENNFVKTTRAQRWQINSSWNGKMGNDWGVPPIDGKKFYFVELGSYWFIVTIGVQSFWAFDENGNLIDVRTRRSSNLL